MTLLKDVRLLLIIGLAIICLLALRLCSAEYQPAALNTTSETGADEQKVSHRESDQASNTQSVVAHSVMAESNTETDNAAHLSNEQLLEETTVPAEISDNPMSEEPASEIEPAVSQEVTVAGKGETSDSAMVKDVDAENAESAVVSDESATSANDAGDEPLGKDIKDVVKDAPEIVQPVADVTANDSGDAAPADGVTTEAAVDHAVHHSNTEVLPVPTAGVKAVYEVVPSLIGDAVDTAVDKIELRAPAASENFIQNLKSDVESVKDGLVQYNEKLEHIDTLVEQLNNPG